MEKPSLLKPGFIFIRNYGNGFGHTGIITTVDGGFIDTIEGNSNNNGSREGIGVFTLRRKINSIEMVLSILVKRLKIQRNIRIVGYWNNICTFAPVFRVEDTNVKDSFWVL